MYGIVIMNQKEIIILWPTDITSLTELTRFEDRWNFRNAYIICIIIIIIVLKKSRLCGQTEVFLYINPLRGKDEAQTALFKDPVRTAL